MIRKYAISGIIGFILGCLVVSGLALAVDGLKEEPITLHLQNQSSFTPEQQRALMDLIQQQNSINRTIFERIRKS